MKLSLRLKSAATILAAICMANATASGAEQRYAASSRLAQGTWMKVHVNAEGIHEISYDQLRAWGFADPAKVNVYGYGATALALDRLSEGADDLPPTPTVHTADGRLLFYADGDLRLDLRNAEGHDDIYRLSSTLWRRNVYDNGAYYFLSDAALNYTPETVAAPAAEGETVYSGHFHVDAHDIDKIAPIKGGTIFCERTFTTEEPVVAELVFRDAVSSEIEGGPERKPVFAYSCYISLDALEKVYNSDTPIEVSVDGAAAQRLSDSKIELDRFSMADYNSLNGSLTFSNASAMPDGSWKVTLTRPAVVTKGVFCFDRHLLVYPRLNRLPAGEAMMLLQYHEATQGATVRIAGYRQGMQLWDVSDPAAVRILALKPDGKGNALATMPEAFDSAKPGRLVLFDPAMSQLQPVAAGAVEAQNLHALDTPDMLIITTHDCETEALRLAEAHKRADGLDVAVCRSRDIFNEFSSGATTPAAYRRLAHMFYSRDPERFRYVLLLGSSLHDMRGVADAVPHEVLAIHEAALADARISASSAYAADSYVGWMTDNESFTDFSRGRMDVAVGRLPARNAGEARSMVNHTIDYIENRPASRYAYHAVMGSGLGDKYEHYLYSAATTGALRRNGVSVYDVPMIAYGNTSDAGKQLQAALSEGCGLFCYYGHSSSGIEVGAASYYSQDIINSLNYKVYPLTMMATCNTFQIDSEVACVASAMLLKEHGGGIGIVGASRSVYSSYNHLLAIALADSYAKGRPGDTTGDIFRRAHNTVVGGNTLESACFNTKCYNLCGDPAVRLPFADASVVLDSFSSEDAAGQAPNGAAMATLKGHVRTNGSKDTDFSGDMRIEIYDTPVAGTVMKEDKGTLPDISLENIRLAVANATVANGEWQADVYIPAFSSPGRAFAVSLDATTDDGRNAHAMYNNQASGTNSEDLTGDDKEPVIAEMYIDTPDFTDGATTGSDIVLHARVEVPSTGLSVNNVALRPTSRVDIDGGSTAAANVAAYCTPAADGSGDMLVDVPFRSLSTGRHHLRLSVGSAAGAFTERSLTFVVHNPAQALLAIDTDGACDTEAAFSIDHSMADGAETRIVISNSAGHTLRLLRDTTVWDLTDDSGAPVADGVYRAHALLSSPSGRTHSNTVDVVVIRNADAQ